MKNSKMVMSVARHRHIYIHKFNRIVICECVDAPRSTDIYVFKRHIDDLEYGRSSIIDAYHHFVADHMRIHIINYRTIYYAIDQ